MGGRNTYAAGRQVPFRWKTVGLFHGIKILQGTGGLHKLPEEGRRIQAAPTCSSIRTEICRCSGFTMKTIF